MVDQTSYGRKQEFQLGRVLGRAFSGVFSNIKQIMLIILFISCVGFLASLSFLLLDNTRPEALFTTPMGLGISILTTILGIALTMFVCIFTDVMAFASFKNATISFSKATRLAAKATLPLALIVFLMILGIYFGVLLLIVPGMILSAGWAVLGPSYLHEDTPLFSSFGRSWDLTHGYKWWVLLAQIIIALVIVILFTITATIQSAFTGINMFDPEAVSQPTTFGSLLITAVVGLIGYLGYCLNASFVVALYAELREIKEGLSAEGATVFD